MDTFIGSIRKNVMGTINKFMVLEREIGLNNNVKNVFFNYYIFFLSEVSETNTIKC